MSTINIHGEDFEVDLDGIWVLITHPRWSLVGIGSTLHEAEMGMIDDAKTVYNTFKDKDPQGVTPEWLDMMNYCQRLTAVKTHAAHM